LASAFTGVVAAGANAAPTTADFKAVSVNHVTLRVPDVQRSTRFYQDLFGMPMKKSSPTVNILALNPNCFFGIETDKGKGAAVDHFSLGIQDFHAHAAAGAQRHHHQRAGFQVWRGVIDIAGHFDGRVKRQRAGF